MRTTNLSALNGFALLIAAFILTACGGGGDGGGSSCSGGNGITVSTSAGSGGSITPSCVTDVIPGTKLGFQTNPDPGYDVCNRFGCGIVCSGTFCTTEPIKADCTVYATFVSHNLPPLPSCPSR
jgi:hypothetical protein